MPQLDPGHRHTFDETFHPDHAHVRDDLETGERLGMAEALLVLLGERHIGVSDAAVQRIRACHDVLELETWVRRATRARTLAEVLDGDS